MQSQDNERTPDLPEERRVPKGPKVTSTLKNENRVNTRRARRVAYSRYCSELRRVPRSDLPSTPRTNFISVNCGYDTSDRKMATIQEEYFIHEEMLLYKMSKFHGARKEGKAFTDKVASLRSVVKRLKEMSVAKRDKVHNKRPEEVMQKLSGIQL